MPKDVAVAAPKTKAANRRKGTGAAAKAKAKALAAKQQPKADEGENPPKRPRKVK